MSHPAPPLPALPVVVLAGGLAGPDDPLRILTGTRPKALLDLGGRPMIDYVLAALEASPQVTEIGVVGLPADAPLPARRIAWRLEDHGSPVANALAGLRRLSGPEGGGRHALISTADIPLLTPPLLADFVADCLPLTHSLYYPVISRERMEARFPGSRRSYARLRDGELAGGDLVLVDRAIVESDHAFWEALAQGRKSVVKLARVVGLGTLLRFALGRLTIRHVERRAERRLGVSVRAVPLRHAELAMDVDKPAQLELVARELGIDTTETPVATARRRPGGH